ncbi:MAG: hypothetical protein BWY40_00006 [bacterium ADurb.Bin270]|nr:MAG: hypothetical protein BWY40_00006 [bacterium ADurb.Bin270]
MTSLSGDLEIAFIDSRQLRALYRQKVFFPFACDGEFYFSIVGDFVRLIFILLGVALRRICLRTWRVGQICVYYELNLLHIYLEFPGCGSHLIRRYSHLFGYCFLASFEYLVHRHDLYRMCADLFWREFYIQIVGYAVLTFPDKFFRDGRREGVAAAPPRRLQFRDGLFCIHDRVCIAKRRLYAYPVYLGFDVEGVFAARGALAAADLERHLVRLNVAPLEGEKPGDPKDIFRRIGGLGLGPSGKPVYLP